MVMKQCLLVATLLLSLLVSTGIPVYAQSSAPDNAAQYGQLRQRFTKDLKQIRHIMMGGPATRATIDLKDALNQMLRLEEDYSTAKASGADAKTLNQFAAKYINLLQTVSEQHSKLYRLVAPVLGDTRATLNMMVNIYPSLVQADAPALRQDLSDTNTALEPVGLGVQRVQEFVNEVRQALQSQQSANPQLKVTNQVVQQEELKAALRILDRRSSQPSDRW